MPVQVLFVDDEPATLIAYKKLLNGSAFNVDFAATLEEAETFLKNNQYQVIVSDLRLSGSHTFEGFYILQLVRKTCPGTQVILLTAYGTSEIKDKALNLGAALYLEKPVRAGELRVAISCLGGVA